MVTPSLRLERRIGKGGMGSVWVAYNEALETEVAIKFIHSDVATKNPAAVRRFKREAGIAAKLKNPHGVHVYDHGILEDDTPYIVMELLEGESLHARLKRDGVLSVHETALVVTQMAQVLGKAHKLGVIHRDVKPPNLFCVDTGYELFIKLLDFGIAKQTTSITDVGLTSTDTMVGSPLYMSPEQFTSAKGVDWRGDLWSLAVVAYRCLVGVSPFKAETLGQVMMKVMTTDYVPATDTNSELPAALDAWFAQAFDKDLEARFQSAKEFADSFVVATRDEATPTGRGRAVSITSLGGKSLGSKSAGDKTVDDKSVDDKSVDDKSVDDKALSEELDSSDSVEKVGAAEARPDVQVTMSSNDVVVDGLPRAVDPTAAIDEEAESATFAPTATLTPTPPSNDDRRVARPGWGRIGAAAVALLVLGGVAAAVAMSGSKDVTAPLDDSASAAFGKGTTIAPPQSTPSAVQSAATSAPIASNVTTAAASASASSHHVDDVASAAASGSASVPHGLQATPPRAWPRPVPQPGPKPNKYGL